MSDTDLTNQELTDLRDALLVAAYHHREIAMENREECALRGIPDDAKNNEALMRESRKWIALDDRFRSVIVAREAQR